MRPWHFSGLGVRKVGAALEFAAMASRRACARKRRGGFLAPPQLLGDQLDGTAGQTLLRPEPRQRPSTSIRRPLVIAFLLNTRFSFTRIFFVVRIEESLERSSTRIDLRQSISRAVHVTLPRLATKDQDHRFAGKNRSSCSQLFCVCRGRSGSFVRPRLLTYARACVTVYRVTKHRREGPATTRDHL